MEAPNLVETLVVYAGAEDGEVKASTDLLKLVPFLLEGDLPPRPDKIHLVHQQEDGGIRAELSQAFQTVTIVDQIFLSLSTFDVEDINQDTDVLEDGGPLRGKIAVHEGVLSAAVPEVEDEVAQESNMVLLDVDCRTQSRGKRRWVVGTDGTVGVQIRGNRILQC